MRDAGEVILQAQGLHDLPRAGPHADARADLGEVARGFINVDVDVGAPGERDGEREAADTASATRDSISARFHKIFDISVYGDE